MGIGLYGALNVSYLTLTGEAPCPAVSGVPICYLVSLGYLLIFVAQLLSSPEWRNKIFFTGWLLVFVIALFGVVAELFYGDICPKNSLAIPLCFVSLGLVMVILLIQILKSRYFPINHIGKI
ncbi:MAG: putative membrane channel-forming protein YqfA (hemolysin III family) [Paraglaciecola sp.]